MDHVLSLAELESALYRAAERETLSPAFDRPYVLVRVPAARGAGRCPQPVCPVVGVMDHPAGAHIPAMAPVVDVVAPDETSLAEITSTIRQQPLASATLVQLLRHNERTTVGDGLFAESLAYSALQHSRGFEAWLDGRRPAAGDPDDDPAVLLRRTDDQLFVTLNRPRKRNAFSLAMRDGLSEALYLALEDESIQQVVVDGAGDNFSAGGDLTEFGSARDAGLAHVVRQTRSPGALIHALGDRISFRLHGACVGAGIELPAFARRVAAAETSFFQLPEVAFGLVPGAGGTVSLLRRIGRLRVAYMALSNRRIDARTALAWGLVDVLG